MTKPPDSIKSVRLVSQSKQQLYPKRDGLLTLTRFKATLRFVDNIRPTFTANHTAIAVTGLQ